MLPTQAVFPLDAIFPGCKHLSLKAPSYYQNTECLRLSLSFLALWKIPSVEWSVYFGLFVLRREVTRAES